MSSGELLGEQRNRLHLHAVQLMVARLEHVVPEPRRAAAVSSAADAKSRRSTTRVSLVEPLSKAPARVLRVRREV